jgi:nucleoside-diphosphate-sugar epimerase
MKVAVAGGGGFLGGHVVAALRDGGHEVLVLGRGTRRVPEDVRGSSSVPVMTC